MPSASYLSTAFFIKLEYKSKSCGGPYKHFSFLEPYLSQSEGFAQEFADFIVTKSFRLFWYVSRYLSSLTQSKLPLLFSIKSHTKPWGPAYLVNLAPISLTFEL